MIIIVIREEKKIKKSILSSMFYSNKYSYVRDFRTITSLKSIIKRVDERFTLARFFSSRQVDKY
jgi:hypothetical protein